MEIRTLRYFLAVAREENMSRACERFKLFLQSRQFGREADVLPQTDVDDDGFSDGIGIGIHIADTFDELALEDEDERVTLHGDNKIREDDLRSRRHAFVSSA